MLVECGLNHPWSGNISWKSEGGFWITRTGAMKSRLERGDFLFCGSDVPAGASVEAGVHRAVYEKTDALALIHAHPPHAIALSFSRTCVEPEDVEGKHFIPRIPVLTLERPSGSAELAGAVANTLASHPCAIVCGHGTFSRGRSLEDAFRTTCTVESACRIIILRGLSKHGP